MSKIESAETIFNKANAAFVDENFTEALELYNTAIEMDPTNAEYYVKRAACHYRLKQFTDAIADANAALKINPKHAQAYLRKGMAAFSLEEYESARASFQKGLELDPSNNAFKTWIRKCDAEMEEADGDVKMKENNQPTERSSTPSTSSSSQPQPESQSQVSSSSQHSQTQNPTPPMTSVSISPAPALIPTSTTTTTTTTQTSVSTSTQADLSNVNQQNVSSSVTTTTTVPESQSAPTTQQQQQQQQQQQRRTVADYKPEPKIRHEWFQTETTVSVQVYVKNVKKEAVTVQIEEQSLEVVIKLPECGEYQLNLDLCDKIIPSKSSYQILSTKIEIILYKSKPCRWLSLEAVPGVEGTTAWGSVVSSTSTPPPPLINKPIATTTTVTSSSTSTSQSTTPAKKVDIWGYPSSKGRKDWDALSKELLGEEKLEGEEALHKVFQDIYANCNDDQKRAMLKSFIESGGTVLSTNWEEVKKGKVKGSPPQGMEMHDWNEDHRL